VRTGTIAGIPYQVHPVWLVIFAIAIVTLVSTLGGGVGDAIETGPRLLIGTVVVILFAGCIVAHELSHAVVARRLGLPLRRVQLLTLGQRAAPAHDPASPSTDLAVVAAGLVFTGVVAGILLGIAAILPRDGDGLVTMAAWTAWWLGFANLVLSGFQLAPVLPLDGGRVVRSLAWAATHDLERATDIVAVVARAFGYVVIGGGLYVAFAVDLFFGLWLMLLGWFAIRLSRSTVERRRMARLTAGFTVADATITDVPSIPGSLTVGTFLEQGQDGPDVLPVTEDGEMVGLLFVAHLRRPLRRPRPDQRIDEVVVPLERAPSCTADEPLQHAVDKLEELRIDALPVIRPDEPGRLHGVVTRQAVLDQIRARHHMARSRDGSASFGARG
jgi:Zn-dependent protease